MKPRCVVSARPIVNVKAVPRLNDKNLHRLKRRIKAMRRYTSALRGFFAPGKISQSLTEIVTGHGPLTKAAEVARTVAGPELTPSLNSVGQPRECLPEFPDSSGKRFPARQLPFLRIQYVKAVVLPRMEMGSADSRRKPKRVRPGRVRFTFMCGHKIQAGNGLPVENDRYAWPKCLPGRITNRKAPEPTTPALSAIGQLARHSYPPCRWNGPTPNSGGGPARDFGLSAKKASTAATSAVTSFATATPHRKAAPL